MIVEFFYPRELKDIIAELRAKDDLNEEVIQNLNKIVYIGLFIYGIGVGVSLSIGNAILSLLLVMVSPCFILMDIRNTYNKYLLPYLGQNERVTSKVTLKQNFTRGQVKYFVENTESRRKYCIEPLIEWKEITMPEEGDYINICISSGSPDRAMPDYLLFKRKYCLRLSRVNGV